LLVGRDSKLESLEKLYNQQKFQLAVLYGTRKTGKTAICSAFAAGKPAIFFSAQKLNSHMNLEAFSRQVFAYAGDDSETPFGTWADAMRYITRLAEKGRLLLILDDFADLAAEDPSVMTAMQRAVDNEWKTTSLFVLISSGRVAFMESDVMGEGSPLFGRRTYQMKLEGLDYLDCAKLLDGFSCEDKLRFYCCVGGTPEYISLIDGAKSFEENIRALYFSARGPLFAQPPRTFLDELREPAVYNSILASLSSGALRLNDIVAATGEDSPKVNKYLQTLLRMQVISRDTPFGEDPAASRKGIYTITDNGLCFWFRFVLPARAAIERGEGDKLFPGEELMRAVDEYVGGKPFESVCYQYLQRQNRLGNLPFLGSVTGKWWRSSKEAGNAELVTATQRTRQLLFAECKWSGAYVADDALKKRLEAKDKLFPEYWERYNYLFSREPFPRELRNMENTKLKLVDCEKLFK